MIIHVKNISTAVGSRTRSRTRSRSRCKNK